MSPFSSRTRTVPLFRLLAVALLTLASACSDSGTGPGTDPGDEPGDDPPDEEWTYTDEARVEALDSTEAIVTSLYGNDFTTISNELVEHFEAHPAFKGATVGENNVLAELQDGRLLVVLDFASLEEDGSQGAPSRVGAVAGGTGFSARDPVLSHGHGALPGLGRTGIDQSPAAAAGKDIPSSSSYRMLNGLSDYYDGTNEMGDSHALLQANGWQGTMGPATLDVLRNVQGPGIFYMRSHGARTQTLAGDTMYALWTQSEEMDLADEKNDSQLVQDLMNKRVVYMMFVNSGWDTMPGWLGGGESTHYGITPAFVSHHMSLSANSLVYIDACESSRYSGLRNAFQQKGASVFAGWSERVLIAKMGPTSKFVFDRLMGADTYEQETPPQRPLDFEALQADPDFGPGEKYGYSVGGSKGNIVANLQFFQLQGDFATLAPSIEYMDVDEETEELTLHGLFGPQSSDGSVTLGGKGLEIRSWTPEEITVALPPNQHGMVVVKIRDHESNPAPLTEWVHTFDYEMDWGPVFFVSEGQLMQRVSCEIHIRADVHPYRTESGQEPEQRETVDFLSAKSSTCDYELTGTAQGDSGETITLSGNGTVTWEAPHHMYAWGEIHPEHRFMDFYWGFLASGTAVITDEDGSQTVALTLARPFQDASFQPVSTRLDLGDDYGIQAGSVGQLWGGQGPQWETMTWKGTDAFSAPDDETFAGLVDPGPGGFLPGGPVPVLRLPGEEVVDDRAP